MRPAGEYKQQISLFRPIVTRDTTGHPISTTATYLTTVWGKVEPLPSPETVDNEMVSSSRKLKIFIRYYPSIDAKCYVSWQGDKYNIIDCMHDPDNAETVLVVGG